jgi:hypothetical protein
MGSPSQSGFRKRDQIHHRAFYYLETVLEQSNLQISGVDADEPTKTNTTVQTLVGSNGFRTFGLF